MSFGQKLQDLRKAQGCSQGKLAEQLNVSRQAVSKWELDVSLPDAENIVQLSKIFNVSTDYLLLDKPTQENTPINNEKGTSKSQMGNGYGNMAFVGSIGAIAIGLLMSIGAWSMWQTFLTVIAGIIVQIVAITIFEVILCRHEDGPAIVRKRFYAIAVWFVLPFPVKFLMDALYQFIVRPRGYLIDVIITVIVYLTVCGLVTYLLRREDIKK